MAKTTTKPNTTKKANSKEDKILLDENITTDSHQRKADSEVFTCFNITFSLNKSKMDLEKKEGLEPFLERLCLELKNKLKPFIE